MAKIGWTIDPTLKVIVGLVVFLVCLLFFLNFMGMFGSSGFSFPHR